MNRTRALVAFLVMTLIAAGHDARLVRAQQVVIVTTTINGTIDVTGVPITGINVRATTPNVTSSSLSLTPGGATSVPYSLAVGLVQGTTPTYAVTADVYSDNGHDVMTLFGSVVVAEGVPAQLNLGTEPGLVDVTFSVTGNASVIGADLTLDKWVSPSVMYRSFTYLLNNTAGDLRFAAVPVDGYRLYGNVRLSNGMSIDLPQRTGLSVASGQTTTVHYDIDGTGAGTIDGVVSFDGPFAVSSVNVHASGPTSGNATFDPAATGGTFSIGPLLAGSYRLSATATLNGGHNQFSFPSRSFTPSRDVSVPATSLVQVAASQASLTVPVRLRGLERPAAITDARMFIGGRVGTLPDGSATTDVLNSENSFVLITSQGDWADGDMNLRLQRNDPFLNERLDFRDTRVITIAAGESAVMPMDLELGEISVRVVRSDGGLLSRPNLRGSCTHRDGNGTVLWTYFIDASSSQVDVTTGTVTFVGPAGDCSVDGSFTAEGQIVGFPAMTLTVVPGVSKDVDAGGPAVTLTTPAAGTILSTNTVVVAGRATDDTGIAAIRVNGVAVAFTSTGNPLDPNEVSFETTLTLAAKGPLSIATSVTDVANPAKTTTDRRTVYWDTDAPTFTFTPVDGATTTSSSIVVSGRADDDGGIKSVTINGAPASLSRTGNSAKPNEMAFVRGISLPVGATAITVVVTDVIDRTVTETHTVTRTAQAPTTLTMSDATGTYGGTTALSARLTLSSSGAGVAGKSVRFAAPGRVFTALTSADGTAVVSQFSLSGINAGDYSVSATFFGDSSNLSSVTTRKLTIAKATPAMNVAGGTFVFDGQPHPAAGFTIGANGETPGPVAFSYSRGGAATGVPTAPGVYTAVGTFAGTQNYVAVMSQPITIVINDAPRIVGLSGPLAPIAVNTAAQVGASFDDAATNDPHTCTFTWADGASSTVAVGAGETSCTSTHTYAASGVYTVAVEIQDDDRLGATGAFQYVVVYDPSAGFVTGSGWIESPSGAYLTDATLSGTAHFGFVSKYHRGAAVPTGSTEFRFDVADLRFQSTSYEWLVIAGRRAQFKGRGSINGSGDYGFLVTAVDGGTGGALDSFRIKIWDRATGGVIYDNAGGAEDLTSSTQAIGGGNIRIQAGT